jgi:hypothetical protein
MYYICGIDKIVNLNLYIKREGCDIKNLAHQIWLKGNRIFRAGILDCIADVSEFQRKFKKWMQKCDLEIIQTKMKNFIHLSITCYREINATIIIHSFYFQ